MHFKETFAPAETFQVLLLIVQHLVFLGTHVHHADISTAILNDDIDVELYDKWGSIYYKPNKSQFRLKQSPHLRYEKLKSPLKTLGTLEWNLVSAFLSSRMAHLNLISYSMSANL